MIPRGIYVVSSAVLALAIFSAWIRREGLREIGIRLDNLAPALRDAALVTAVPVVSLLAAGAAMGSVRADWIVTVERLPWLVVWGFLQQYVLQGFVHRRMNEVLRADAAREILTAAIFAACHLPNWRLMIATFIGGWIWAVLYRRHPNLLALAIAHAVSSAAVSIAFGPALLHGMKVGRGYFTYEAPPTAPR
jgi:membrane protease YdiL (CAAX protease family)